VKRSKRLGADPAKVREFLQRGRGSLTRTSAPERKPIAAKRRVKPVEGPLDPRRWRQEVFRASGGKCIVSGARARDADDRRFHAHHPLDKDALRKRGLHGYLWDPRNGAWVSTPVHWQHEHSGGEGRIARERLPASVWEFCAELDALDGSEWATAKVEREHPATGHGGTTSPRRTD
jgi:hypothetical protein